MAGATAGVVADEIRNSKKSRMQRVRGTIARLRTLDLGGIAYTVYRLLKDIDFITEVKKEYMETNFDRLISGPNVSRPIYKEAMHTAL